MATIVVHTNTASCRVRKCCSSWKTSRTSLNTHHCQYSRKSNSTPQAKLLKSSFKLKPTVSVTFSKHRALRSAKKVYMFFATKCQQYIGFSPALHTDYMVNSTTSLSKLIRRVAHCTQINNLSSTKKPHFAFSANNVLEERLCSKTVNMDDEPVVYFSESYNYYSYSSFNRKSVNTMGIASDQSCNSSSDAQDSVDKRSSDALVESDVIDAVSKTSTAREGADIEPAQNRPSSQYDYMIQTAAQGQQETTENPILTSFKSLVEIPMNSFISFISRSNLLDKSEAPNDGVDKDVVPLGSSEETDVVAAEKKEASSPISLLDSLIKFIPYGLTSTPDLGNEQITVEIGEVERERIRIQSEKEKIAKKIEINNRTRHLIKSIRNSNSLTSLTRHLEDLKNHLIQFPDTRVAAVKENAIRDLIHAYRTTYDKDVLPTIRMTLALLGAVDPPKKNGIRVLCIDGGGVRGVVAVEVFRRIVELSGQPIHEMFDYICGVSTGAILAFLLGIKKIPIEDVELIYRNLAGEIFSQTPLVGAGKLMMSHAYYSTETLEKILSTVFGDKMMIESAADEDVPKCSAVSCLVNRLVLKPFLWRNYSIVPGTRHAHWPGTCRGKMWEALRASSAAPGYFEEYKKDHNIHQDGGLLTNNPAGVAMNECKVLWPNAPIQCVVSVGTGRYEPSIGPTSENFLSLKDKILKVLDSATSVSEVHAVMSDLLPHGTYFRFNPFIREPVQLNDYEESNLNLLVEDTREYIERNDYKFRACVDTLMDRKRVFAR